MPHTTGTQALHNICTAAADKYLVLLFNGYFGMMAKAASAHRSPSIAADTMPPA